MAHFIVESPIFQEAEIVKRTPEKAIFRMTMQTTDEKNKNRRKYPNQIVREGINECSERMKRRAFYGEMDHPVPTGNRDFDIIRQTTVSLKEVCHLIRDYEFQGNKLIGELETTRTPNGNILLGLLRDRSGLGLSLRGMGEIEKEDNNTDIVKGPLLIISYDSVSLPSHTAAVVDFNECKFESQMLVESQNLVCHNGHCYLPNYFDKLVESKMITFFSKWV
jgi:hypothetical protein